MIVVRCSDLGEHLAAVQQRCAATGSSRAGEDECAALLAEVKALASYIDHVRHELAVIGADELVAHHFPAATDELDAVVTHTAAATGTILDVCEQLEQVSPAAVNQAVISEATARIYEACSFQDITGQRVAKVVQTLQLVETRVAAILLVFGESSRVQEHRVQPTPLMNGPQRPGDAMDQEAIDNLMADLQ